MKLKRLRRDFTRSVKQYKWGIVFLFGYALFLGIIGRYGLNLDLERDRVWFQGFIALGLALFIFFQFSLDYRNRRRNILYEKQIDALMEFHSIVHDLFFTINFGFKESLSSIDSIKMVVQRHDQFKKMGKDQFVANMAKRSPNVTLEEIYQRIYRIDSLCRFFENMKFNPTDIFDLKRKITTWEVLSLEKKKDLSEFSKSFKLPEVSIGDLLLEMAQFALELRVIIEEELDVL